MAETVICLHRENIDSSSIGTCRICGQQRQYYPYEGHRVEVIERGFINGVMTDITPPTADNSQPIPEEQEMAPVTDLMPANWHKLNKVQKKRWFDSVKKQILKDVEELGPSKAREKWGIIASTWAGLAHRWGFKATDSPRRKKVKQPVPKAIPSPQTAEPEETKEEKAPWPPPRRTDRSGVRGVYEF